MNAQQAREVLGRTRIRVRGDGGWRCIYLSDDGPVVGTALNERGDSYRFHETLSDKGKIVPLDHLAPGWMFRTQDINTIMRWLESGPLPVEAVHKKARKYREQIETLKIRGLLEETQVKGTLCLTPTALWMFVREVV